MKPREVERMLLAQGWVRVPGRGKGSHRIYEHADREDRLVLPWHGGKDLPKGTVVAILKQAGVT